MKKQNFKFSMLAIMSAMVLSSFLFFSFTLTYKSDNYYLKLNYDNDSVYSVPEKLPEFQGGVKALYDYLNDNIKIPDNLKNVDFEGTSFISFIVEKDGAISNVEIKRSCGNKKCDDIAVDVVKKMPQWIPGRNIKNEVVRVSFMLPVKFVTSKKGNTNK